MASLKLCYEMNSAEIAKQDNVLDEIILVFYHLYFPSIIRYHEAEKQRHKFSQVFSHELAFLSAI